LGPRRRRTAVLEGGPMFDLIYLVLLAVLTLISIGMIRFFDRM
jgi:hypothetical protein